MFIRTKRSFFILLQILLLLVPFQGFSFDRQVKIACVGNSITYGSGIINRERLSYPAQLQEWMGNLYQVKNFGVPGATLLEKGNKPYVQQNAYQESMSFQPDIVIIMLGTNDTKPQNWKFADAFVNDYIRLVHSFKSLYSKPRVILALPVPVFVPDKWGIRDSVVREGVIPKVKEIAAKTHCELIDLYQPLLPYGKFFPDKVHPNSLGAAIMVEEIYKQLFHRTGTYGLGKFNSATYPVPSAEYRSEAAGWGKGKDWMSQHEAINKIGLSRPVDLVFLGNSITQGWGSDDRKLWSSVPELWDSLYKPRNAANFGISGDRTQHVLWRIRNGNFDHIHPKAIVLVIGVNNFPSNTAEEIAQGIKAIVTALRKKVPETRILLLGPFPTGKDESDPWRVKYHKIQKLIQPLDHLSGVKYLNIGGPYILTNGQLNHKLMRNDNIHLTPQGYYTWAASIEPVLKEWGL